MKQFVAILFLIAYGLTSFGAPVAVHPCSDKQHASFHPSAAACGPVLATPGNCCNGSQPVCTVKTDENTLERSSYKVPGFEHASAAFVFADGQGKYNSFVSLLSAKSDVALTLYKVRLHLFKRVLLI